MSFSISVISEDVAASMKSKNIWCSDCPIKIANLRLLDLLHYNFDGKLKHGQMVVHEKISENVVSIFQELSKIKFPIEKIRLIDEYDGSDELSMSDNNSSCFNYRMIANSDVISMHSYGLAIDINPVQNPYILDEEVANVLKIWPEVGKAYLNRANQRAGMVEQVVSIFKSNGLKIWGGDWSSPLDYHHFQVDRADLQDFI